MLDTVLLLATLTGITFVPEAIVPRAVWAMIVGVYCLIALGLKSFRTHPLPDSELAHLLGGVLCITFAVALTLDSRRPILGLGIALAATFIAGVVWSAWRADSPHTP